tara:strand:+ start:786 stop:1301 length:516 start_codon:yes stop_codon:yes gene_type:complete
MFLKKIILIFTLILLSSCGPYWYKPMGKIFKQAPKAPKEASYGFRLGWIHGCESGLATNFAGVFFMTFYEWKKDHDLLAQPLDKVKLSKRYRKELPIDWNNDREVNKNITDYNTIFWRVHQYCRHYALGSLRMVGFNPSLPGKGNRFMLGDHSIKDLYRLDGFGDTRWSHW